MRPGRFLWLINRISFVFSFRHKTQDAQQSPLTVYQTVMDEAGTLNTWVKEQKTKTCVPGAENVCFEFFTLNL